MNRLPATQSNTVLHQKRKIINEDGSSMKAYYDGRQWRRLCAVYKCEKLVHSQGFCARHLKQATDGELTSDYEPGYDLPFSEQSNSIIETIEDSEQNILTSFRKTFLN